MKVIVALVVCLALVYCVVSQSSECSPTLATDASYWTREKMDSAIPRDMIFNNATGKFEIRKLTACSGKNQLYNKAQDTPLYTKFPFSAIGKIFFNLGNQTYVCSGAITDPHTVITAGHCTFESSVGFATNLIFVPGYHNKEEPLGRYTASSLCTTSQFQSGTMSYDYAIARFETALPTEVTGFLPLAINLDATKTQYTSCGYPQGPPFDGQWENTCDSDLCVRDWWMPNPQPVGIVCDSTGGSSGGPWLTASRFLSGLNSYGYAFQSGRMYGPYFDSDTLRFVVKHRIPTK
eukprot:TRINITY_DN508_c0_g1_i1.p1 TRINITY_DN508_c0_g1~~TRINITY_DN508_c0_g1_i1.p1  ORF type:complete len:306 (-),score=55.46 TRINITY_DN508_c0_g1_i1:42-917(-)